MKFTSRFGKPAMVLLPVLVLAATALSCDVPAANMGPVAPVPDIGWTRPDPAPARHLFSASAPLSLSRRGFVRKPLALLEIAAHC